MKRRAIKNFIKVLLSIERAIVDLDPINYRFIPVNELLSFFAGDTYDWNNHDGNTNKGKDIWWQLCAPQDASPG